MPLEWVSGTGSADRYCPPAAGGAFDARPSVNDLPDVQSELFEQVTDDELAKHH